MKINNWNIVTVKTPSGEEITVGFNDKEGVLRIRKPGWVPLEITPAEIEEGEVVSILPDIRYYQDYSGRGEVVIK